MTPDRSAGCIVAAFWLILFSIAALTLYGAARTTADCEARGGHYVRGAFSWECVQTIPTEETP